MGVGVIRGGLGIIRVSLHIDCIITVNLAFTRNLDARRRGGSGGFVMEHICPYYMPNGAAIFGKRPKCFNNLFPSDKMINFLIRVKIFRIFLEYF